jgi:hypothetical protein
LKFARSIVVKKKSRVGGLEDIRPTDSVFQDALESDEQLFPPTLEEKEDAQRKRAAADLCYSDAQSDDDFAEAQKLNLLAEGAKLELDEKTSKYESVRHCLRTAEAAERMELSASSKDFMKAGQWKLIKTKLAKRFESHTAQQKKDAAEAAAAVGATKRQRSDAQRSLAPVDLTAVSRNYLQRCTYT